MLLFIDDSGDPGFKLTCGSSPFFVLALVIFDDELDAEIASVKIKELRRSFGFPDDLEFKFNKSSRPVRERFLETIRTCQFRVRSVVVEKARLQRSISDKASFYEFVIRTALARSEGAIRDAKVRIDGSAERVFRRQFLASLRRLSPRGTQRLVRDYKLVKSKGNVLVQMTDMIAGAIRRSYDTTKTDRLVYKNIIRDKSETRLRTSGYWGNKKRPQGAFFNHVPRPVSQPRRRPATVQNTGFYTFTILPDLDNNYCYRDHHG